MNSYLLYEGYIIHSEHICKRSLKKTLTLTLTEQYRTNDTFDLSYNSDVLVLGQSIGFKIL